jgi:hypothetical protein
MISKTHLTAGFLSIVLLLGGGVAVSAQESDRNPLTDSQIASASEISTSSDVDAIQLAPPSGMLQSSTKVNAERVYKLADCDTSSEESACYIVLYGGVEVIRSEVKLDGPSLNASPFQTTQHCGVSIYNHFGQETARLQQNINVTYWEGNMRPPVTLNTGDLGASYAYFPLSCNTSGPTPNVAWGQETWGNVHIVAHGDLKTVHGGSNFYSTVMNITSSGTFCT